MSDQAAAGADNPLLVTLGHSAAGARLVARSSHYDVYFGTNRRPIHHGARVVGLAASDANERDAVLYLHGYNVSFATASLRAAQLGYDLGSMTLASAG